MLIVKKDAIEYETDQNFILRKIVNQKKFKIKMSRRTENFNNDRFQQDQTSKSFTNSEKFDFIDEIMKNKSSSSKTIRNNSNASFVSLISLISKIQQKRATRNKAQIQFIKIVKTNEKMFDFND